MDIIYFPISPFDAKIVRLENIRRQMQNSATILLDEFENFSGQGIKLDIDNLVAFGYTLNYAVPERIHVPSKRARYH
jgi:hypothetical protein